MADMLKFKKGLYENLPAVSAATVGTIYVTTDEKAMYVDVAADQRIRIGDFIRVESVKDIVPPFSTSSLYYVEADNALLKYDGTAWKQVNGTDDIRLAINSINGSIDSINDEIDGIDTSIETINTTLGTHGEAIEALEETVEGHGTDIAALKAAVGMNEEGEIEGLAGLVAGLRTDLDALDGTVEDHEDRLDALEEASAKHAEKTYVDSTFAKAADVYTKTEVYTQTEADNKISAAVSAEATIARAAEEANAAAAQAAKDRADEAFTLADGKIDLAGVQALNYATKSEVEKSVGDAIAEEVRRADGKYTTLTDKAAMDAATQAAKDRADAAYSLADSKTTMAAVEAKGYATEVKASELAAAAKQAAIDDAATKYTTLTDKAAMDAATQAAKDRADEAYELADGKTTMAAVEAVLADYALSSTVTSDISKAIADEVKRADEKYATLEQKAAMDAAIEAAQDKADEAYTLAGQGVADAAAAQTTANTAVANAATAQSAAEAAQGKADDNADRLDVIESTFATKEELNDAKEELQGSIDTQIDAANAMTYKNTITAAEQLPNPSEEEVKIGDTYVVGSNFRLEGVQMYAGDMIIATGAEVDGVLEEVTWKRVETGYSSALDPNLSVADNTIKLSSLDTTDGDLGKVVIAGAEGVQVTTKVVEGQATIEIANVWGEF